MLYRRAPALVPFCVEAFVGSTGDWVGLDISIVGAGIRLGDEVGDPSSLAFVGDSDMVGAPDGGTVPVELVVEGEGTLASGLSLGTCEAVGGFVIGE